MSTYRTGRHWGVTIVRESGPQPCAQVGPHYCVALGENAEHDAAQLVAVVVNGDQALAERICELLNGETPPCPAGPSCYQLDEAAP